jgi:hypothetical protein
MAMRPLGRDEALQHLFVLGIGLGAFFVIVDLMVMAALRRPKA